MKLLWLNHRDILHPRAGGAERTIQEVGRRLVQMGHEVNLVCATWRGSPGHAIVDGVRVRRFLGPAGPHLALPWLLRQNPPPDVVVDDLAHVVPWATPRLARVPGVAFFRHLHARSLPGQVPLGAAAALAAAERTYPILYHDWQFVTEARSSVDDLIGLGVPQSQCKVIRPGVDTDLFRPGRKTIIPQLVYFGGLRRYKRPSHALYAFRRLDEGGFDGTLVVVGDGPELTNLKVLTRRLGLEGRVSFPGRLQTHELAHLLSSSWINIHCSQTEGWGYSVLEAAAAGVPTAAYRVPGIVESVSDGNTGCLVPDNDPQELGDAVLEMVGHQGGWASRCRTYAESMPWESCASQWATALSNLIP